MFGKTIHSCSLCDYKTNRKPDREIYFNMKHATKNLNTLNT